MTGWTGSKGRAGMGSGEVILAENEPSGKAGPFPKRVGDAGR